MLEMLEYIINTFIIPVWAYTAQLAIPVACLVYIFVPAKPNKPITTIGGDVIGTDKLNADLAILIAVIMLLLPIVIFITVISLLISSIKLIHNFVQKRLYNL